MENTRMQASKFMPYIYSQVQQVTEGNKMMPQIIIWMLATNFVTCWQNCEKYRMIWVLQQTINEV